MSYDKDTLQLVINPANKTRTIFTEYFYRRLLLASITGVQYDSGTHVFTNKQISDTALQNEDDGGSNDLPTGLYTPVAGSVDFTKYPLVGGYDHSGTEPFGDTTHYPIKCDASSLGLLYNFPMFYKIVYGMVVNPTAVSTMYNPNHVYGTTPYMYYQTAKYNPWYTYGSSISQYIQFNPPSWHTNPTGRNNASPNILNAVPWGNLVVPPSKIAIDVNMSPYDTNKNQIKLTIDLDVSDVYNTSADYQIISGQYYLNCMAIVDYDFQPLIISTFPIITVGSGYTAQDELTVDFGANLVQPV